MAKDNKLDGEKILQKIQQKVFRKYTDRTLFQDNSSFLSLSHHFSVFKQDIFPIPPLAIVIFPIREIKKPGEIASFFTILFQEEDDSIQDIAENLIKSFDILPSAVFMLIWRNNEWFTVITGREESTVLAIEKILGVNGVSKSN